MRTARTVAFWMLAAALVAGHAVVAWHSLVTLRLWEDEAFNLTVARNLLDGLGYTSDGTLSGSTLTPFDPRISTGPAVLLPVAAVLATGIEPVVGARLIPLAYWVLLIAGLAVLGRRIGGRWAALIAIAVPLAFNTTAGVSPIQGPADLLGEIPAAALIVWALVVLPRRAWLAGLLVGLAVQAKLIALLALPAFAVALFLMQPGASTGAASGWRRLGALVRRSWVPLLFVALPTFLVELFALISLGWIGFIDHLRALVAFVRSGGQVGEPTTLTQKVHTALDSWFIPPWAAALAAVIAIALVLAGVVITRRSAARTADPVPAADGAGDARLAVLAAAAVGILTYLAWWATASHLPLWVRHPAPALFAFTPILAAGAIWGCLVLMRARRARVIAVRVVAVTGPVVLAVAVGAGGVLHVTATTQPRWETLAAQQASADELREWVEANDAAWLAADPWGAPVSSVVLSGAHVGLFDAGAMAGVPRLTDHECTTEVLAESGRYRICAAP